MTMRAVQHPFYTDLRANDSASSEASHYLPAALQSLLDMPREAAWQELIDALPVAIALVADVDGRPRILARNSAFIHLSDRRRNFCQESEGEDLSRGIALPLLAALRDFLGSDEADRTLSMQEGDGIGGRHFSVHMVRLRSDGAPFRRCILSLVDRTQQVESERSLRAEMLHDSLTGLPNRVAFAEQVDQYIGQDMSTPRKFAVLVADLTRFSRVNEGVGSLAGDELIITVARRLVSTLRSGDFLARLAGDEFAVLLAVGDNESDALHAARRIQGCFATPVRLGDLEIKIDCAVGCALMAPGVESAEDIIRNAQFAMKRAKYSGHAEIYRSSDSAAARQRFSLETELRRAIERDQLTLAFQPLIALDSGRVAGFEALARWEHPERGTISPVEFIPVAEESGLIIPLGRWALRAALRALAEWDRRNGKTLPIYMTVNVSAVQFQRDDVVSAVQSALMESGIAGARLKLELTESCIVSDPEGITAVLKDIHDLDVRIAMDDFGTGYSSLAYLQRLPIDALKIDRSFIMPMLKDRDSTAIVRAVLSLASALGMTTTAEGVETAELAESLVALGCDIAQGYYFARPLPLDEAYAYMSSRNASASS
ncbi:diguanylate cyclase/phosphodiesterase [Sphingomonas sp. YR710]|uniref:putative bifunctional diguanylate cyclase/phosphodiesterase n=1 Tax=Sphingomonas sp. YR710 TaxID=1882773 RepID=UPI00087FB98A|nr:EAL domain-containing protein [Sphingomonas sp. YR710]SDD34147.1 diguanylate cyclase/phosphodiesterase [Sphingomonas sp. YR710]